ncbi:MAG: hypothetical protein C4548_00095 [Desulfobacteraceae bacterium]|jgi:hypothetical protein|nr:MAG: hypothetical protein C4548_00095 [Desulfobacteraceae bacterium]
MLISKDISRLSDDGRYLYIDMRPRLDVYLRYAHWDEGLIVHRLDGNGWELENRDPNILLLTPEHVSNVNLPVHAFIQSIPMDIRTTVTRFDHLQTKVLQLLAVSKAAKDLLQDIPLLLWLLADWAQNPDVTMGDIKTLLRKKRAAILSVILSRESGENNIKFLKKIVPRDFNHRQFHFIRHYLYNDGAGAFRHWPEVPYDALVILKNHLEMVSCRLIKDITSWDYKALSALAPNRSPIINLISDTISMGRDLGVADPMSIINRCDTLTDLQLLHDKWVRKFNLRQTPISHAPLFPDPPIPGNLNIQPIMTEDELLQEGRIMRHCVGGYKSKVREGSSYIYRVIKPERATLEIRKNGRSLSIGQFKLADNQKPSEASKAEVIRWIEDFKKTTSAAFLSIGEEKLRQIPTKMLPHHYVNGFFNVINIEEYIKKRDLQLGI